MLKVTMTSGTPLVRQLLLGRWVLPDVDPSVIGSQQGLSSRVANRQPPSYSKMTNPHRTESIVFGVFTIPMLRREDLLAHLIHVIRQSTLTCS